MKTPLELLAELRSRDLLDRAEQIAARYHVKLSDVCTPSHRPELVAPRHAIWLDQVDELGSQNAVARLWGVDHTTVMAAVDGDGREIVRVVLDEYRADKHDFRLLWTDGGDPFLIVDRAIGKKYAFATYAIARAAWIALLEQSGRPTFRSVAMHPPHPPPLPSVASDGGAA